MLLLSLISLFAVYFFQGTMTQISGTKQGFVMQQKWYFQHFSVQIAFLWEFPQEKPQSKNAVIVRISICSLAQLKQVIQCYSLIHFYARLLQGFNRQITLKIMKLICHKMSQDDTSKGTVSFWIAVIYKMCKLTFASKMRLMFLCPSCRKKRKLTGNTFPSSSQTHIITSTFL